MEKISNRNVYYKVKCIFGQVYLLYLCALLMRLRISYIYIYLYIYIYIFIYIYIYIYIYIKFFNTMKFEIIRRNETTPFNLQNTFRIPSSVSN